MHLKKDLSKLVNFYVAILISKMEEEKQHFWHIMLYYFKKGKNATETHKKIRALYGEGAVTDQTCQSGLEVSCWRFLVGQCSMVSRPVEVDSNQMETLIEINQCYNRQERANILKMSKSSIENHLNQVGYVNRFDVWVPRKLSEKKPS